VSGKGQTLCNTPQVSGRGQTLLPVCNTPRVSGKGQTLCNAPQVSGKGSHSSLFATHHGCQVRARHSCLSATHHRSQVRARHSATHHRSQVRARHSHREQKRITHRSFELIVLDLYGDFHLSAFLLILQNLEKEESRSGTELLGEGGESN